jgi:hypothetical protein
MDMNENRRNELLDGYPPDVARLASRLCDVVRGGVPEAVESIRPGWRYVAFTHPEVGYFGGVFPREDTVQVGFEFGVLLPDPERLLTGFGSQLRYLVASLSDEPPAAALEALLRAATDLPSNACVRRQMVRALAR